MVGRTLLLEKDGIIVTQGKIIDFRHVSTSWTYLFLIEEVPSGTLRVVDYAASTGTGYRLVLQPESQNING